MILMADVEMQVVLLWYCLTEGRVMSGGSKWIWYAVEFTSLLIGLDSQHARSILIDMIPEVDLKVASSVSVESEVTGNRN